MLWFLFNIFCIHYRDILSIGVGCLSSGLWLLSVTLFTFLHAHVFIYEIPDDNIDEHQDVVTRRKEVRLYYNIIPRILNKCIQNAEKGPDSLMCIFLSRLSNFLKAHSWLYFQYNSKIKDEVAWH